MLFWNGSSVVSLNEAEGGNENRSASVVYTNCISYHTLRHISEVSERSVVRRLWRCRGSRKIESASNGQGGGGSQHVVSHGRLVRNQVDAWCIVWSETVKRTG